MKAAITFALASLMLTAPALADTDLIVPLASHEVGETYEIGSVEVPGLGLVQLIASRNGRTVVLRAQGPDGALIARGESTVGLRETPVVVPTPSGYETIRVRWQPPEPPATPPPSP